MSRPLNLATRPFRNDRLPTLLLAIGCLGLLGLSVRHGLVARDLLPARTAEVDGELVALEEEVARLRSEAAQLSTRSASPEALQEWAVLRDLVDRRAFSWSALLGHLEPVVPANIRLLSLAPVTARGQLEVGISAVGRSVEDGLEFLEALQQSPHFEAPFLTSVREASDGINFLFTMGYVPDSAPAASGGGK